MVKQQRPHPYRTGNYAPVDTERGLTPCHCQGRVPEELAGGMYVRNGANPIAKNEDRPYHWFDGDGMLQGVYFTRVGNECQAMFVNRHVLTDVLLATPEDATLPIIPSISTLLGPLHQLPTVVMAISRAVALSALSFAFKTRQAVQRISVANTSVTYHDGRALATCESGPMAWFRLPSLETVGWWDLGDEQEPGLREKNGPLGFMKEWTTAHPKRDPDTQELVLYHSLMLPPYLSYSVIPSKGAKMATKRIMGYPVPIPGPRMMHDFAASHSHTVLIDTPLSLDPLNLARGVPIVSFSPTVPARFGIFPRHDPESQLEGEEDLNVVCCRLNSSRLVYAAGNLDMPSSEPQTEHDTCLLYYYQFDLARTASPNAKRSFALSSIPFEFPTVAFKQSMRGPTFVYGCSMKMGSFSAALGSAAKIDCLVKMNIKSLIKQGLARGLGREDAVDQRTVVEVLEAHSNQAGAPDDVQIFALPQGWYAQESSFVPRQDAESEDDGYLLTYVFDESQLDEKGEAREDARSELWIINALTMTDVVAKVKLPQRVPYGLHGNWFTESEIQLQRPVPGAAAKHAAEPFDAPVLDKYTLLERQRQLIATERSLTGTRTRKTLVGPGKHWSSKQLEQLEPTTFAKLRCNEVATGKALVCRVISKCVRTASVQFIVESEDGLVAPVHLHRWPVNLCAALDDEFIIGNIYAIKEPSLRELDQGFCVRIDSPPDLIELMPSSHLLKSMTFKPLRLPIVVKSAEELKIEGNHFVGSKRWSAARHSYSLAIDRAKSSAGTALDRKQLAPLLVNRSLCHLELKHPGRAMSDCRRAAELELSDSLRLKCLWRHALGAYRLGQYDVAQELLLQASRIDQGQRGIQDQQAKVASCILQRTKGQYDWHDIWQRAQTEAVHKVLEDVAEYVSPAVQIQTIKGKGRGLVATRPIARGDLILVQKPLALGVTDQDRQALVVGANLFTRGMHPYSFVDALAEAAHRWTDDDPNFRHAIMNLTSDGQLPASVESLKISGESPGLDMSRLEAILSRNAFRAHSIVPRPEFAGTELQAATSMYSTLSMINHSCIVNVTFNSIVGMIVVRARQDIAAGEELRESYVNAAAELEDREAGLTFHGFVCTCQLCQFDRKESTEQRTRRKPLQAEVDELMSIYMAASRDDTVGKNHIAARLQQIRVQIEETYDQTRPKTLRPALSNVLSALENIALDACDVVKMIDFAVTKMECLGCVVDTKDASQPRLEVPPKLDDVEPVESALKVARQLKMEGNFKASQNWLELARDIERGQIGLELADLRAQTLSTVCVP
ncbi:hypothetical protein OIO90_003673 [Microbotryomycetes sp. JL221]|nr:hypothetical protein OIO90_003673 [Microbotryomycetes sp. JL221]